MSPDLVDLRNSIETFRRAAGDAGHDPGSLLVVIRVNGAVTAHPPAERSLLTGAVVQVADDLAELEELDVDQVFWDMGTDPNEQLEGLERLLAQLGPA